MEANKRSLIYHFSKKFRRNKIELNNFASLLFIYSIETRESEKYSIVPYEQIDKIKINNHKEHRYGGLIFIENMTSQARDKKNWNSFP